jgi:hypothetical protein
MQARGKEISRTTAAYSSRGVQEGLQGKIAEV